MRLRGRRAYRRFRGKLLRELREAGLLTQDALAAELGCTRFVISKWETERDNPHPAMVVKICAFFQVPDDYFYDGDEQQQIIASVTLGHLASFTDSGPIIVQAARQILVFQTGGPKAPTWWRENLRNHLVGKEGEVQYRVVLCVDPEQVTPQLLDKMAIAEHDFQGSIVDLKIFEQKPQLGIDMMIVDTQHVFLGLHSHNLSNRHCSIHFQDRRVAEALSTWLLTLSPVTDYQSWRKVQNW